MEPITDIILSFALSYLANCIPTLQNLQDNNNSKLKKRVELCYTKAVEEWKNDTVCKKYRGKEPENLEKLKEFLKGDVKNIDEELLILVERWGKHMRDDVYCMQYINEIKIDDIRETIKNNEGILNIIKTINDRIDSSTNRITSKLDDSIRRTEGIDKKLDIVLDSIGDTKNDDSLNGANDDSNDRNAILFELQKRGKKNKNDQKLFNLSEWIIDQTTKYVRYTAKLMPEFVLQDESHSAIVLKNIEELLGEKKIKEIASVDLFMLVASSYLHDCAMGLSIWETKVLELAEKEDVPVIVDNPKKIILDNIQSIYSDFSQIKEWLFCPEKEQELISYFSDLYEGFQIFRNGYLGKYKVENKDRLNVKIRIDYIRTTHHVRIRQYIPHLKKKVSDIIEPDIAKGLLEFLGTVVYSHGTPINEVEKIPISYSLPGTTAQKGNLQFDAMMLRLSDIIHFNHDRAPHALMNQKKFESNYSSYHWMIKEGLDYTIDKNICFRCHCDNPDLYFRLNKYMDWIDDEIDNYDNLRSQWPHLYNIKVPKVDRTELRPDSSYIPKMDLKFTLEHDRIMDLLKGIGLYKKPFACLRELYQNSLDACRCMMSMVESNGIIEFGLLEDTKGKYLYCLDNGKGMSHDIIEKYFVRIGSSYYKSNDFFREQAATGSKFTPTSQFGIGILSCFIIGEKIEVLTREMGKEYISFAVDGLLDYFYYHTTISSEDKRKIDNIGTSGTLIKVYLQNKYCCENELHNEELTTPGIYISDRFKLIKKEPYYSDFSKHWENHLYNYISNFVQIVPNGISVRVRFENDEYLEIKNRPFSIQDSEEKWNIQEEDIELFNGSFHLADVLKKQNEVIRYPINISHGRMEYRCYVAIPKPGYKINKQSYGSFYGLYSTYSPVNVDGIAISERDSLSGSISSYLMENGSINFVGENKPAISVDRCSLLPSPINVESESKEIVLLLIKEIINQSFLHIERFEINIMSDDYNDIWKYIFSLFESVKNLMVNVLYDENIGKIVWNGLEKIVNRAMTISDFLSVREVELTTKHIDSIDDYTQLFLVSKLISSTHTKLLSESSFILTSDGNNASIPINAKYFKDLVFRPSDDSGLFKEYDLISDLYPFISESLFNNLPSNFIIVNSKEEKKVQLNPKLAAFFRQDPVFVSPDTGFYLKSSTKGGLHSLNRLNKRNDELYGRNPRLSRPLVVMIYLCPRVLCPLEKQDLEKEVNQTRKNGIVNGWTVLAEFEIPSTKYFIYPGKLSRKEIVQRLLLAPKRGEWGDCDSWKNKQFCDGSTLGSYLI